MPMTPVTMGSAFASLGPFFEFFRPTRSPYLLVVLFSVIGLLVLNFLFDIESRLYNYWYALAIPLFLVVGVLTIFVFLHRESLETADEERDVAEHHLKFARSICISIAIICFVGGCWFAVDQKSTSMFILHYVACICQIAVFTVYAAARLRRKEPAGLLNHFQVALVTSLYLMAATVCVVFIAMKQGESCGDVGRTSIFETCIRGEKLASFYAISYFVFLALWAWCQYYWISRLRQIIKISVHDS